eukprot:CAMPEP_0202968042 /NCGR_PEP_ID=MMETSP1396-20130829/13154_1 /ASSEMBLY_ACC=CAM_ASM_000872 /TAXON_ID= /ORGANISM="Pseudokeronopsis sp., Strain Brazil" /LENGTH=63 /DNA_ID=CAMNT_0049693859 /DNA_START=1 /DNA_END=192 /DNA_ORIENTATION=+
MKMFALYKDQEEALDLNRQRKKNDYIFEKYQQEFQMDVQIDVDDDNEFRTVIPPWNSSVEPLE